MSAPPAVAVGRLASHARSRAALRLFRKLRARPTAFVASMLLLLFLLMAAFPGLFAATSPSDQDLLNRLLPPSGIGGHHPLGTDYLGRDLLARLVYGARVSVLVGVTSVAGAGVLGMAVGLLSGYFGGRIDDLVAFWVNVQLSLPFLLVAIVLMAFVQPGLRSVIAVIIVTTWVTYARVVRATVLGVKEATYVEAARALGVPDRRVLIRHVMPNVLAPFTIIATLEIARVVVLEASLSFLGMGVPPATPSWGGMLSEGRRYMISAPWLATLAGACIMLLVLSVNIVGDFLRDYMDPRLRI